MAPGPLPPPCILHLHAPPLLPSVGQAPPPPVRPRLAGRPPPVPSVSLRVCPFCLPFALGRLVAAGAEGGQLGAAGRAQPGEPERAGGPQCRAGPPARGVRPGARPGALLAPTPPRTRQPPRATSRRSLSGGSCHAAQRWFLRPLRAAPAVGGDARWGAPPGPAWSGQGRGEGAGQGQGLRARNPVIIKHVELDSSADSAGRQTPVAGDTT